MASGRRFSRILQKAGAQLRQQFPDRAGAELIDITDDDRGVVKLDSGAIITIPFPPAGASAIGKGAKGEIQFVRRGNKSTPQWRTCCERNTRPDEPISLNWTNHFANGARTNGITGKFFNPVIALESMGVSPDSVQFLRQDNGSLAWVNGSSLFVDGVEIFDGNVSEPGWDGGEFWDWNALTYKDGVLYLVHSGAALAAIKNDGTFLWTWTIFNDWGLAGGYYPGNFDGYYDDNCADPVVTSNGRVLCTGIRTDVSRLRLAISTDAATGTLHWVEWCESPSGWGRSIITAELYEKRPHFHVQEGPDLTRMLITDFAGRVVCLGLYPEESPYLRVEWRTELDNINEMRMAIMGTNPRSVLVWRDFHDLEEVRDDLIDDDLQWDGQTSLGDYRYPFKDPDVAPIGLRGGVVALSLEDGSEIRATDEPGSVAYKTDNGPMHDYFKDGPIYNWSAPGRQGGTVPSWLWWHHNTASWAPILFNQAGYWTDPDFDPETDADWIDERDNTIIPFVQARNSTTPDGSDFKNWLIEVETEALRILDLEIARIETMGETRNSPTHLLRQEFMRCNFNAYINDEVTGPGAGGVNAFIKNLTLQWPDWNILAGGKPNISSLSEYDNAFEELYDAPYFFDNPVPIDLTVEDEEERFALTDAEVQEDDTIYQVDTEEVFTVVDIEKLDDPEGYLLYKNYQIRPDTYNGGLSSSAFTVVPFRQYSGYTSITRVSFRSDSGDATYQFRYVWRDPNEREILRTPTPPILIGCTCWTGRLHVAAGEDDDYFQWRAYNWAGHEEWRVTIRKDQDKDLSLLGAPFASSGMVHTNINFDGESKLFTLTTAGDVFSEDRPCPQLENPTFDGVAGWLAGDGTKKFTN